MEGNSSREKFPIFSYIASCSPRLHLGFESSQLGLKTDDGDERIDGLLPQTQEKIIHRVCSAQGLIASRHVTLFTIVQEPEGSSYITTPFSNGYLTILFGCALQANIRTRRGVAATKVARLSCGTN